MWKKQFWLALAATSCMAAPALAQSVDYAGKTVSILAGGGGTRLWPLSRPERPKPFLPLLAGGQTPLAATLAVVPTIPVAGLALNLVAVPVMAVTQVVGMAATVGDAVSPALGRTLGWVAAWCADALVRSGHAVRSVPWSHWRVAAPSWTSPILCDLPV